MFRLFAEGARGLLQEFQLNFEPESHKLCMKTKQKHPIDPIYLKINSSKNRNAKGQKSSSTTQITVCELKLMQRSKRADTRHWIRGCPGSWATCSKRPLSGRLAFGKKCERPHECSEGSAASAACCCVEAGEVKHAKRNLKISDETCF